MAAIATLESLKANKWYFFGFCTIWNFL